MSAGRILQLEELVAELDRLRAAGRRIAFANGHFDLLHVGHLRYLTAARATADALDQPSLLFALAAHVTRPDIHLSPTIAPMPDDLHPQGLWRRSARVRASLPTTVRSSQGQPPQ